MISLYLCVSVCLNILLIFFIIKSMLNYNSASDLRAFLENEGLGMRKKFGQNFLINPQVRLALVEALGADAGAEVWEIGPGLGAMTSLLLKKGLKVKAFEIDLGFIRILKKLFSGGKNFKLIEGDALKTWHSQKIESYAEKETCAASQKKPPFLLGNLPYNIAAVLLADFIEKGQFFSRMVVTVQKEVALRMTAKAGTPDYSSFSVLCASVYDVKQLMTIRPSSFYPQPNVDSMGVLLERRQQTLSNCDCPLFFYSLVRALFESRRKTIKNNLLTFLSSRLRLMNASGCKEICDTVLRENSLNGSERAEKLDFEAFLSLAKTIDNMRILNSDVNCRKHS